MCAREVCVAVVYMYVSVYALADVSVSDVCACVSCKDSQKRILRGEGGGRSDKQVDA